MILILIVTLLILAIAYFQAIQGLFSAMIMLILTVLSAVVAFNFYQPLAEAFLYERIPEAADGIALALLFVVPLIGLWLGMDALIRENITLNVWVDRIAGGFLGLIAGIICTGVLTTAMQMFPFDRAILSFEPFDGSLTRSQSLAPFSPDRFTVGLFDSLSKGGLTTGDDTSFSAAHDDLLAELFAWRNTAGLGGRIDALPDAIKIKGIYEPLEQQLPVLLNVPANPMIPSSKPTKTLIVRAQVSNSAMNDKPRWWLLPGTHFRLVGQTGKSYYPMAYLTYENQGRWAVHVPQMKGAKPQIADLAVQRPAMKGKKSLTVDWVYQIEQNDKPAELIFRRTAKVKAPKVTADSIPDSNTALRRKVPPKKKRR